MQQITTESSASVFLMPSLYQETIQLLLNARDYFQYEGKLVESNLYGTRRQQFTMEMSRITLRLSCTMARLAVQKAICVGDISREEATQNYPLDGQNICLESNVVAEHELPRPMRILLENSLMLYERIHRLDQQTKRYH